MAMRKCWMGLVAATPLVFGAVAAGQPAIDKPQEQPLVAGMTQQQRSAHRAAYQAMPDTPGSGPYPALYEAVSGLPDHIVYRPADLRRMGAKKLGVVIWGNGGCTDDGASARLHLSEIASHGYVAIAAGAIRSGPRFSGVYDDNRFLKTTQDDLRRALDWILAENARKGSAYYRKIDPNAVVVSGSSCGGLQAIIVAPDPRIKGVILHVSGILPNKPERPQYVMDRKMLDAIKMPILYLVGNRSDVAFQPSLEDFAYISRVPVVRASRNDVGHEGTFAQPNGGSMAKVATDWLEWQLRKDARAGHTFTGTDCGICTDPKWSVMRKGLP